MTTSVTGLYYFNVLNTTEEGVYRCGVSSLATFGYYTARETINVTSMFLFNNHSKQLHVIMLLGQALSITSPVFINSTSSTNQSDSDAD